MKKKDEEPNVWITALKLFVGAVILIGGTGLALWYVDQMQEKEKPVPGSGSDVSGWGILSDNPLRMRR